MHPCGRGKIASPGGCARRRVSERNRRRRLLALQMKLSSGARLMRDGDMFRIGMHVRRRRNKSAVINQPSASSNCSAAYPHPPLRGTFPPGEGIWVHSKDDTERGSDASAACGRESELSEWQRSTDAKALRRRRQMSGTATGQGSNELLSTVHALSGGIAALTMTGRF